MTRRLPILMALLLVSILALACSSAAPAPSSAPASTQPAAEASKPPASAAASAPAASKPAGTSSPSASASGDWKAEWETVVAAAKKEGTVTVAGGRGDSYATAAMAFQKAYPDIKLQFTGVDGSQFSPKITTERAAEQYLWDVWIGGTNTFFSMIPKGVLDPIRPALLLPEVKDESKWLGGFDDLLADKAKQYVFGFEARLSPTLWVNRGVIPESQLNDPDQLLDPRWKGKIVWMDPRTVGSGGKKASVLYALKGEDWLRKFLGQDIFLVSSGRPVIEELVRGSHPLALGVNSADIVQYRREGLADSLHPLALDKPGMAALDSGFGNVTLVNKAPHPNAAKVFLNWVLSIEGQTAYVKATESNSRRLDVKGAEDTAPKLGLLNSTTEEFDINVKRANALSKELLK